MKADSKVVNGIKGVKYFFIPLMGLPLLGGFYIVFRELRNGEFDLLSILSAAFLIIALPFFYLNFPRKLSVSQDHLYLLTYMKKYSIPYTMIKRIGVGTDFFGGIHLQLSWRESGSSGKLKHMQINTGLFQNQDEIAKAVVEAVYYNNPSAEIHSSVEVFDGSPPYGIL